MTVLVDTSFLFALTNRNDKSHQACVQVAQSLQSRMVVPVTVLPEIAYLLDSRLGHQVMQQFIEQITRPGWTLEGVTQADLQRASELLQQYADNRLDFVDSTLIALAERINIRRILTLDRRHFDVVRSQHCDAFELLP